MEGVQHHYAHVLSCMAENSLSGNVLGVSWDGTGLGSDGTLWGGEFLRVDDTGFERVATFRSFPLPGGDAAAREPRRSAAGILFEFLGENWLSYAESLSFAAEDAEVIQSMLRSGVNCPRTSSAGRLFDGVASLLGLCHRASFEGQAAISLEQEAEKSGTSNSYDHDVFCRDGLSVVDWEPMLGQILGDMKAGSQISCVARAFHNTLISIVIDIARNSGEREVVLTGGCFQNSILLGGSIERLNEGGFNPHWHASVPPNDGGLALGQLMAVSRSAGKETI